MDNVTLCELFPNYQHSELMEVLSSVPGLLQEPFENQVRYLLDMGEKRKIFDDNNINSKKPKYSHAYPWPVGTRLQISGRYRVVLGYSNDINTEPSNQIVTTSSLSSGLVEAATAKSILDSTYHIANDRPLHKYTIGPLKLSFSFCIPKSVDFGYLDAKTNLTKKLIKSEATQSMVANLFSCEMLPFCHFVRLEQSEWIPTMLIEIDRIPVASYFCTRGHLTWCNQINISTDKLATCSCHQFTVHQRQGFGFRMPLFYPTGDMTTYKILENKHDQICFQVTCSAMVKLSPIMDMSFVFVEYMMQFATIERPIDSPWQWNKTKLSTFEVLNMFKPINLTNGLLLQRNHRLHPQVLTNLSKTHCMYNFFDYDNEKLIKIEDDIKQSVPGLVLFPYQIKIIQFMMFQEAEGSLYERMFVWNNNLQNYKLDTRKLQLEIKYIVPPIEENKDWFDEADDFDHQVHNESYLLDEKEVVVEDQHRILGKKRTGGVLGLEMRLGKTIITLSFLSYLKKIHSQRKPPTLIVASVNCIIKSWIPELETRFENLKWISTTQFPRRDFVIQTDLFEYDIILVSESRLIDFVTDIVLPYQENRQKYERIVIDEAHEFSRYNTSTFKSLTRIESNYFWMLTGTPFTHKSGVGALGPLVNTAFGFVLPCSKYKRLDKSSTDKFNSVFDRFVQLGVIIMNSEDVFVKEVTSEKTIEMKVQIIDDNDYPYFKNQYRALLGTAPKNGLLFGYPTIPLDTIFLHQLRRCCSSYLNVREILAHARQQHIQRLGESQDRFIELVGDGSVTNELVKKTDSCCICMDDLFEPFHLNCRHVLCHRCTAQLLERNHNISLKCPLCRAESFKSQIREVRWKSDIPEEEEKKSELNEDFGYNMMDHPKMIYLFHLLDEIKPTSTNKMIIFSDIKDTLYTIGILLSQSEIYRNSFLRMTPSMNTTRRSKIFQDFNDPESNYSILIIPVSIGSVGIDLSVASTAVFMEPFIDLSKDLQSMNRLYHVKKHHAIKLHYLVLKNTIEETILKECPNNFQFQQPIRYTSRSLTETLLRSMIRL